MSNSNQTPLIDIIEINQEENQIARLERRVKALEEEVEKINDEIKCFFCFYMSCIIINIVWVLIQWGMRFP